MSKLKFTPLGDRVLIRPDDGESITKSGMVIPETSKEQVVTGVVLAMGPKVVAGLINLGDRVVYSPHSVYSAKVDGEPLVYVRECDCHFVITPENRIANSKFSYGDTVRIIKNFQVEGEPAGMDRVGVIGILKTTPDHSGWVTVEFEAQDSPLLPPKTHQLYFQIKNEKDELVVDQHIELVTDQN